MEILAMVREIHARELTARRRSNSNLRFLERENGTLSYVRKSEQQQRGREATS